MAVSLVLFLFYVTQLISVHRERGTAGGAYPPFVLYALVSIAILLATGSGPAIWVFAGTILFLPVRAWWMGRERSSDSMSGVMKSDGRLPVFLLRSFEEDITPAANALMAGPIIGVANILMGRLSLTFEEMINPGIFRQIGPLIAVQHPARDARFEASRARFPEESWRDMVGEIVKNVSCAVFLEGRTVALLAEAEQIRSHMNPQRVFFMTHPESLRRRGRFREYRREWTQLAAQYTEAGIRLPENDPGPGAVVSFNREWDPVVLCQGLRRGDEYARIISSRLRVIPVDRSIPDPDFQALDAYLSREFKPVHAGTRGATEVHGILQVTLEDVVLGREVETQVARPEPCVECHSRMDSRREDQGACRSCGGSGVQEVTRTVVVRIPPGVDSGARLRLGGSLLPVKDKEEPLLLQVEVMPHPIFQRQGLDLVCSLTVDEELARKGGVIEISTLDGKTTLTLPASAQDGSRVVIEGRGIERRRLSDLSSVVRGNLVVLVKVR